MKIWLDDLRYPPDDSWTWFDSFSGFMEALQSMNCAPTAVSFDHDLGSYENGAKAAQEFCIYGDSIGWNPNYIRMESHSSNPPGKKNIESHFATWVKYYNMKGGN